MTTPKRPKIAVSFSLWGTDQNYLDGAIRQAADYQDWSQHGPFDITTVFFVGDTITNELVDELTSRDAAVYRMCTYPEDFTATFWRFAAFNRLGPGIRGGCDVVFCRDVDSKLTIREQDAIVEFVASGRGFHIIRDHPTHTTGEYPIPAGLFGAVARMRPLLPGCLPTVPPGWFHTSLVPDPGSNNFHHVDERWLANVVYPIVRDEVLAHQQAGTAVIDADTRTLRAASDGETLIGEYYTR